ncbi:MAG TPA: GNAT family N-acetyltransferase [Ilumatobacteraceae bacterium]|nr:GNAT family N-acetyltransferase [Ilumatobacteraceae bacterium]
MTDARPGLHVRRRDDHAQYELYDGDELLSFAPFSQVDGVVIVPHIETRLHHRGNGYSSRLMEGLVADLRERGLRIDPVCPVARWYVQALPDADELMVD